MKVLKTTKSMASGVQRAAKPPTGCLRSCGSSDTARKSAASGIVAGRPSIDRWDKATTPVAATCTGRSSGIRTATNSASTSHGTATTSSPTSPQGEPRYWPFSTKWPTATSSGIRENSERTAVAGFMRIPTPRNLPPSTDVHNRRSTSHGRSANEGIQANLPRRVGTRRPLA